MKVSGNAELDASIERVWSALLDAEFLARTIPGCQRLEPSGPDSYEMTATAGVGLVRGTYAGQVRLSDFDPPNGLHLHASGEGAPGTVTTDVEVHLTSTGESSTRIDYEADAVIGGMIAGVGQRVLASVSRRTADEFFAAINRELNGGITARTLPADDGAPLPGDQLHSSTTSASNANSESINALTKGSLIGAAIALAGVLVGRTTSRRHHSPLKRP